MEVSGLCAITSDDANGRLVRLEGGKMQPIGTFPLGRYGGHICQDKYIYPFVWKGRLHGVITNEWVFTIYEIHDGVFVEVISYDLVRMKKCDDIRFPNHLKRLDIAHAIDADDDGNLVFWSNSNGIQIIVANMVGSIQVYNYTHETDEYKRVARAGSPKYGLRPVAYDRATGKRYATCIIDSVINSWSLKCIHLTDADITLAILGLQNPPHRIEHVAVRNGTIVVAFARMIFSINLVTGCVWEIINMGVDNSSRSMSMLSDNILCFSGIYDIIANGKTCTVSDFYNMADFTSHIVCYDDVYPIKIKSILH